MSNQVISDKSSDREYFTITPRLVWALCRSPYDYTLWCVIKDIAGEQGECFLSTPDLACLAMMSTGKVSECREHLIQCGLLKGQVRKDPGYPQPVWHITIPNIWAKNLEWCEAHAKISDRLEYKGKQLSPDECCELSPGERGTTPDENGTSPDETKKNHKEEPKEKPYSPNGEVKARAKSERQLALADLEAFFSSKTNIPLPKRVTIQQKKYGSIRWWIPLGNIWELVGKDLDRAHGVIEMAITKMRDDRLTISAPQSIEQVCISLASEEMCDETLEISL